MSGLFDKVARDLQDSFLTLSERAGEWLKTGAEAVRGGVETASTKAALVSKVAKLKWEQNLLQSEIEKAFTALGGQAYELFSAGRLQDLENVGREKLEQLRALEQKLEEKEKEVENLSKNFSATSANAPDMNDLRQDLEGAGGKILQVTISAQSFAANKALHEIVLPGDILIGAIVRAEEMIIPARDTILLPGDRITLLGKKEAVLQAAHIFGGRN